MGTWYWFTNGWLLKVKHKNKKTWNRITSLQLVKIYSVNDRHFWIILQVQFSSKNKYKLYLLLTHKNNSQINIMLVSIIWHFFYNLKDYKKCHRQLNINALIFSEDNFSNISTYCWGIELLLATHQNPHLKCEKVSVLHSSMIFGENVNNCTRTKSIFNLL